MKVTLTTVSFQVSDKMLEYATTSSPEAAALFGRSLLEKMDTGQEHVILLVVNAANTVTGFKVISSGGTDTLLLMRRSMQSSPMFPLGRFDEKKWRQYLWAYFRMIEKVDAISAACCALCGKATSWIVP
jgi:hypothetical protein